MTKNEAIIVMGYTGVSMVNFEDFHGDVEKRLGYPIWTHQFADRDLMEKVQEAYKEDFIKLCESVEE
jgi:hypothetical protein